ncbi:pyrroloquinoline quinone biosynthesis peptide chaperone PqqD [Stutzerimonas stutzeri]|uniref:pyrroloquinoline quinone biosynthesis peptide chaperone PqqD n=1 Tax=Stutzerimonas sp. S1 TaxID=3030652 RepID=UPI0022250885|nr:pyrroloquinoline quinone biosynthesis peptide chaperone PqqD [Stutzerimonas sp. S1]MCW3148192.1 pyrroloquinoline quinone biosynthesis peptide chaperone PqqD [Stutzerimonas sp. S1]
MSDDILLKVPALRRGFRFQFEPAQQCHVLLYPEGMIKLNDSASEIFKRMDGARTVGGIIADLQTSFPGAEGIEEDILAFLEVAVERFWIELR